MNYTQEAKDFQRLIERFAQNNALQTIKNSNVSENAKEGTRSVIQFTINEIDWAIRSFNEDIDYEDDSITKRLCFSTSYGARKESGGIMYRDNSDKFTFFVVCCNYTYGYNKKIMLDINIKKTVKMYRDTSGVLAHPIREKKDEWDLHMQFKKQNNELFYSQYRVNDNDVFKLEL